MQHLHAPLSLPLSEYGMSRSATLVLAYIMKCNRMALSQAMDFVKERKPGIRLVVHVHMDNVTVVLRQN